MKKIIVVYILTFLFIENNGNYKFLKKNCQFIDQSINQFIDQFVEKSYPFIEKSSRFITKQKIALYGFIEKNKVKNGMLLFGCVLMSGAFFVAIPLAIAEMEKGLPPSK